ncbi:NAD(P)/FAD-dependent oxidoreductase [Pseudomonas sp. GD03860]|uniref:NAD(P)/FAD-dependent oxidoreductase n=1 Tax=Pseudomonas TaxID=286 RepID=UPI002363738D|nr:MULTISPECIES: NAD(P)/FAD-dependent oxidoreductase [Pseudomonas]MDD2058972.1 NAD(P)/FAD-dependent oxidoreductase [Pseudomonas putida]MDH0639451.1 NAD(P)/FAD-dependent oxidoreductase [Pseudomonas sp. GD03860]
MKQHILIVGAGFGGVWSALSAARLLDRHGRSDVAISVLAPQAELRIRPRFYEPDVHQMKAPLIDLFNAVGVNFIQGAADEIDVAGKRVGYTDANGQRITLAYDRLVMAAGSGVWRPNLDGLHEHAFDVDQIESAARLEQHLKLLASQPDSAARNTVVVAGGGFTGIETATEMPARLRAILGADTAVRVIIVDRGAKIGAALGEGISPTIIEACQALGVEWRVNASVASVDANGVTLADGQRIEARTVVWTVGVRASSLTAQVPAERDAQGRLHVDRNLKVKGQEHVYAAGDVAYAATDDLGNFAVMSCQHAIVLGRHSGNNVAADLLGVAPTPYRQPKYVTCLDLGAWGAVYTEGWDRQVKLLQKEAKDLKTQINTTWIYPPAADRAAALAAADPLIPIA